MARLIQFIEKKQFVVWKNKDGHTCGATQLICVVEDDEGQIHMIPDFDYNCVNHMTADEMMKRHLGRDQFYVMEGMNDGLFDELIECEKRDNGGCWFDALTEVLGYMERGQFRLPKEYADRLEELLKKIDTVIGLSRNQFKLF